MILLFACYLVSPGSVQANGVDDDGHGEMGFSGNIQAAAIWISTTSQLYVEDDNKKVTSLSREADATVEILPLILFEFQYTFSTGSGIYLKTLFEEEFGLSAGVTHALPFGSIDISGFYELFGEVWKNPYAVGVDREETDVSTIGGDLKLEELFGTGLSLDYAYRDVDVDEDTIGETSTVLRRDGGIHRMSTQYGVEFGDGNMISPGFTYTMGDMDGESNAWSGYEAELSYMRMTPSHMIFLSVSMEHNDYDAVHPVFGKTREEDIYGVMGMFTWLNPMGLDKWFINFGGGFEKTDANIDFFDSDTYFGLTSIGYNF